MKKALLCFFFAVLGIGGLSAQSIDVTAPCLGTTFSFALDAANSPDATGRNVYFYMPTSIEIRFNSGANRWEIRARGGSFDVYYVNSFTSSPNPPDNVTSAWDDFGFCDGTGAPTVTGSGTQSTLGGDPCASLGGDTDGDGVCDDNDICPGFDDNADMDSDGIPDGCDANPTVPDGVLIEATCLDPDPILFTLSGTDGTGRNVYSTSFANGLEVRYNAALGRWEVRASSGTMDVYLFNTFASFPDPPSVGTWTGTTVLNCNTAPAPTVSGSGTQTTLGCTIAVGTPSVTQPPCGGDGVISVTASGAKGSVTYSLKQSGSVISSNASGSFTGLNAGPYTVLASDDAFPAGVCEDETASITLVVQDNVPPTVLTCPGDQTLTANVDCQGVLIDFTNLLSVADNCDPSPDIAQTPGMGTAVDEGAVVSFTVSDDAGNDNMTCSFMIVLDDPNGFCNQPPTARCQNVRVAVGADCTAFITPQQVDNGSFDPDGDPITLSLDNDGPFGPGSYTVELTADDGTETASCSANVMVSDGTAPIPPAPPTDLMLDCADDVPPPVDLTAVDNCDGDITVSPSAQITPGVCLNDFVMVRTWVFTDMAGNTSSISQTITVLDTLAPVLPVPPADLNLDCAADVPPPVSLTAVDNCDGDITVNPSATITPGACLNDFVMVRTWTFSDTCGNTSSISQTITVLDTLAPVLPVPPADLNLDCAADVPPPVSLTAVDNCDGNITVNPSATITPGACLNDFVMVRTWTFSDTCGNTSSISQTITVLDTLAPVLPVPPADLNLDCAADVPPPVSLTAVDNCDGDITVNPSATITPGACLNDFVMVRTWTFSDTCGNTSSISQTITVLDTLAPVLPVPPADLNLDCAADVPPPVSLTAVDNCDGDITVNPSATITPGACLNDFVMVRTWTFSDTCGNTSSISQTITVLDTLAPVLPVPPADLNLDCAADVPPPVSLTAVDNCDGDITVNPSATITPGACLNDFVMVRTWTFSDTCGNTSSVSQTISVSDDTAPVISCPPSVFDLVCDAELDLPYTTVSGFVAAGGTVFDNCSDIENMTIAVDEQASGTTCTGITVTRTYTITDECGNTSESCEQVFTFLPPAEAVVQLPSFPTAISCADASNFTAPAVDYDNGQSGDCSISGTLLPNVIPDFNKCDGGTIIIFYNNTDACGRPIVVEPPIVIEVSPAPIPTVEDPGLPAEITCAEAAVFQAPAVNYSNGETGACEISGTLLPNVVADFDQCGGTITIFYNNTDECDRSVAVIPPVVITVQAAPEATVDDPGLPAEITCAEAAVFTAPEVSYSNGETGACEISGTLLPNVVADFDQCGGTITVFYNNADACDRPVAVIPPVVIAVQAAPEATVDDPGLPAGPLTCAAAEAFSAPGVGYSNGEAGVCEISGMLLPNVVRDYDKCQGGTITVYYGNEDECGRMVGLDPIIIPVLPTPAPEFEAQPGNITVDCIDDVTTNELGYDNGQEGNCEISGSVTSTQEELVPYDGCNGSFEEIWEVTDECGTTIRTSRTVTIRRAVAGSAETVDELVCNNMTEILIAYAVAGEPGIPNQYMIDADAAAEAAGFADVDWTALSGSPLSYPMVEGTEPGIYNFVFKVRDSDCPSCIDESPFTMEVVPPDFNLTCVGQVNVNLQDDCQATLDWDDVLTGSFRCLDESDYTVIVEDGNTANGGTVDGCGTYKFTVSGPDNFGCWGYVLAEDKQAPVCSDNLDDVRGWDGTSYDYQLFVCDDIEQLLLADGASYVLDADGNLIPGSFSSAHAEWVLTDVTGIMEFTDNCGDITVTVSDEVIHGEDPNCDVVKIRRTFQGKDSCKGLESGTCEQYIYISKPSLKEVYCPDDVEIDCEDTVKLDANGNPHPDVTGYPWYYTAFDNDDLDDDDNTWEGKGIAYLNTSSCNLGASYTDGERIEVCEGTYKIIRTWEILDWCSKDYIECKQIIKVGDYEAPEVLCAEVDYDNDGKADLRTYSTGPYDCTAAFAVPMPVVKDNCSSWEVLTEIVGFSTDGPVVATIAPGASRYVSGIPLGCHFIKYTVTDACGNKRVEFCPFRVEDQVAPIAVCDDDLNVSIGGQGLARVYAADIDEGSSDNCGPIRIEVRRRILDPFAYECLDMFDYDGDGEVIEDEINESVQFGDPDGDGPGEVFWYTPWAEYVDFTCCDMNENVRIELRVWDDRNGDGYPGNTIETYLCGDYDAADVTDNYNVCWMDLLIEDKLPAYCVPPLPAYIDCDDLPYDFDPTDVAQMTELFDEATGSDNCPGYEVTELAPLTDDLNDCGYGTFVRRFQVSDAKGLTSTNKCEQVVTIREQHKYTIKFPKDAEAICGIAQADTIETEELACDLLAVSVKDDFFSASGDECYKIFRTYSVINWCEYDGISEPVVVSRDEDCDGKPGDEDVWVIVMTMNDPDPCYDYYGGYQADYYSHVWYDRDNDPFNLVPKAGTKGFNCEYETNPFGFWKEVTPITENEPKGKDTDNYPDGYYGDHCDDMASVGYWQYTQVIKVYDNIDPIVEFTAPDPFCSYSSDFAADCPAEVSIDFAIDENCTPDDLTITIYLDAGADGVIDEDITDLLSGTYPNYNVTGSFPLGSHMIGVSVEDGCGNQSGTNIPFEVVDCKAPAPACINGLAIELMPVIPAADVDGDGDEDKAAMAIWASDFIASPNTDCTDPIKYSINRVGEEVDEDQTGITLTCDDDASLLVEIWAWDGVGNGDFCETYVLVQDNMVQCDGGTGSIAGVIATEELTTVSGVEIALSGNSFATMNTTDDGHFLFNALEEGFDYTITPLLESNPLNGVSTFDLVLMSKHILGLQTLNTPYKLLSADVNKDGRVTAQDAIALRRLILNIDTKFANNTSWRFVDASYQFSVPSNPWADNFPEVINVNDLQGSLANADFVAFKTGDLSLDAKANAMTAETRSNQGLFELNVTDVAMTAGNEYRIDVTAAELAKLQGFQGTFSLDNSKVELVDIEYGIAKAANFGMHLIDRGLITTSWDGNADNNEVLFTMVVRSRDDVELSKVLAVNSRITAAEAYNANDETMDLAINFGNGEVVSAGFELGQNSPNPFRTQTMINFNLPEAAEVTFSITDAAGKLLNVIRTSGVQGNNILTLERNDLPAGVLFYTLTTNDFTATKSMVIE